MRRLFNGGLAANHCCCHVRFSERLTQAEERENGHNHYDQSDEVNETIHVFLVFLGVDLILFRTGHLDGQTWTSVSKSATGGHQHRSADKDHKHGAY